MFRITLLFLLFWISNSYSTPATIISTIEHPSGIYHNQGGQIYQCCGTTDCMNSICSEYSNATDIALILMIPWDHNFTNYENATCFGPNGNIDISIKRDSTIIGLSVVDYGPRKGFNAIPNLNFTCVDAIDCLSFICDLYGHNNRLDLIGIIPNNKSKDCI